MERATLELAREAGLDVPETRLVKLPDNREVMLIERFDRQAGPNGLTRRHMVSALTMLGVSGMDSPNMRYADIADVIGARAPRDRVQRDREEMFGQMVFNILVSNNDDHLRNHAFLYDAEASGWRLSPLYDVVPATSPSLERDLHLTVGDMGRAARLDNALTSAGQFNLRRPEAARIIDRIHRVVRQWRMTFEAKGVSVRDCDYIESAFLHARHLGWTRCCPPWTRNSRSQTPAECGRRWPPTRAALLEHAEATDVREDRESGAARTGDESPPRRDDNSGSAVDRGDLAQTLTQPPEVERQCCYVPTLLQRRSRMRICLAAKVFHSRKNCRRAFDQT